MGRNRISMIHMSWKQHATTEEKREDARLQALIGIAWADIVMYQKARKLVTNRCIKRAAYALKRKNGKRR